MKNIDAFNLCTAHVLATLYAQFPVRRKLEPGELVADMKGALEGEVVKGVDANNFVAHTISWLVETGYLIKRDGATTSNNKYVLSPKAFEAMNSSLPSSLAGAKAEETKTVGQKLSELAVDTGKKAGEEARNQAISQAVGQVIGWAMKTFVGPG